MLLGWRILLSFVALIAFGIWAQIAYARYVSRYCVIHELPRHAAGQLMFLSSTTKMWQIMSERQREPQLERLRRRALGRAILMGMGMFGMFLFVAVGGPA